MKTPHESGPPDEIPNSPAGQKHVGVLPEVGDEGCATTPGAIRPRQSPEGFDLLLQLSQTIPFQD
jgi:hypothetical protein